MIFSISRLLGTSIFFLFRAGGRILVPIKKFSIAIGCLRCKKVKKDEHAETIKRILKLESLLVFICIIKSSDSFALKNKIFKFFSSQYLSKIFIACPYFCLVCQLLHCLKNISFSLLFRPTFRAVSQAQARCTRTNS